MWVELSDKEIEYFGKATSEEIYEFYKGYDEWLAEIDEEFRPEEP